MVENLRLLFQDVNAVHINRYGSLQDWIHEASGKKYWNQLVNCLLHPNTPLLERPAAWGPPPSWRARRATNSRCPADHDGDNGDDGDNDDGNNDGGNEDGNDGDNRSNRCHQPSPLPQQAPPPTQATTKQPAPP